MAEAAPPTRDDQDACLQQRALGPVVANLALAPFWLLPFTSLVSLLTEHQNDGGRLQIWTGSAVLSTIVIAVAVTAYRRRPVGTLKPWLVKLLRAGMMSIGVTLGLSAWVAGRAPIDMVMLFALFPTTAGALSAMMTAGRRDLYLSVLVPMATLSSFTLATSGDLRLRGLAVLWVFYAATL
ncbi:MAG: hypothetical protein QOJ74_115, partial [Ilumatobacteraceae bacterium]|nr:hypothetical protein [Ilumatobacteraceae bacterium]